MKNFGKRTKNNLKKLGFEFTKNLKLASHKKQKPTGDQIRIKEKFWVAENYRIFMMFGRKF
ncbi:MAG: hypothetical protein CM15mP31_0040 [Gammaproteobacteria bacterium]|nr:MAG: hypothetical protein CM15mP31_0040 [Gammaproteobacteria bacterium]